MHDFGVIIENWNYQSFLEPHQPIWNWEILKYDWVELSDKILNLLFKNGVDWL